MIGQGEGDAANARLSGIKSAEADQTVLTVEYLQALTRIGDGRATKLVIPADFSGLLGTVAAITAAVNPDDGTDEVRPKRGLPIPDESATGRASRRAVRMRGTAMKVSDAPRAGWYPDPEGRTRLRWWDGTDWLDRYRLRPLGSQTQGELEIAVASTPERRRPGVRPGAARATRCTCRRRRRPSSSRSGLRPGPRRSARPRTSRPGRVAITGEIPPLISQYTNRFMRWFRLALALSFIVLMAWFIYTVFVQKSFFDWLGDRIDNLTDDTNSRRRIGAVERSAGGDRRPQPLGFAA